ncbi:hypothetical protein HDU67_004958 [Dinochytrium kinnereticum]|nr:hypothetical protein HDU67_004958 [Dinochytrium kinnereticum]
MAKRHRALHHGSIKRLTSPKQEAALEDDSNSTSLNAFVDGNAARKRSIPWRDMAPVVPLDGIGMMVLGGRTGTESSPYGPYYTLGSAAPNEAELTANPKDIWVLRSSSGQFIQPPLEGNAVVGFGHSCVFFKPKSLVVCTGGFSRTGEAKRLTLQIFRRTGGTFSVSSYGVQENGPGMEDSECPGRGLHSSLLLGDKIYLFGGQPCLYCSSPPWGGINTAVIDMSADIPLLSYAYSEDSDAPALGQFTGSCAVALPSGRGLIIGGAFMDSGSPAALSDLLWLFDPKTNGYRAVKNTRGGGPSPRWGASCAYSRGVIYVHGGCDPASNTGPQDGTTYMLNVTSYPWVWSKATGGAANGPGPRCFGSASVYRNYVVFVGGQTSKTSAADNSTVPANGKSRSSRKGKGKKRGKKGKSSENSRSKSARTPHMPLFAPFDADDMFSWESVEEDEVDADNSAEESIEAEDFADDDLYRRSLERRAPGDEGDLGFYLFDRRTSAWVNPAAVASLDLSPTVPEPSAPSSTRPANPIGPQPSQSPSSPSASASPTATNRTTPTQSVTGAPPAKSSLQDPGIIAGIVFGCLILVAMIAAIVWYIFKSRKANGAPGITQRRFGKLPTFGSGGRRPISSIFGNTLKKRSQFQTLPDRQEMSFAPHDMSSTSQFAGPSNANAHAAGSIPIPGPSSLEMPPTPVLDRRATGRASTTALGARFFDPSKNTFIPLLAPIKDDFTENDEVIAQVTNTIAEELGDPCNIPLGEATNGYLGLSLSSVPLRTYSKNVTYNSLTNTNNDESLNPFLDPRAETRQPGELSLPPSLLGHVKFQVIYPYEPQADGEIELRWGEILTVRKFFKDGWGIGYNETTQVSGAFPVFAIEEIEEVLVQPQSPVPLTPAVETPPLQTSAPGSAVELNSGAMSPTTHIEPLQSGDTVSRGGRHGGSSV